MGIVLSARFMFRLDGDLEQLAVRSGLPLRKLLRYAVSLLVLAAFAGVAFWTQLLVKYWLWFAEYALLLASIFADIGRGSCDLVFAGDPRTQNACFIADCGKSRAFSASRPVLDPYLALLPAASVAVQAQ